MELNPTVPQWKFIFSESKYPAFVGGFGSGKTEALIARAIIGKMAHPDNDRAFYEPTYDLIRMIAWPRFEEMLTSMNIPYRLTRHPHNVLQIDGCGQIIFRSMDTPARIIGYEVGDSDVDELDTLKRDDAADVWRRILSRNRQSKDGQNTAAVATTPEGFRFVYETWAQKQPPGYELIKAPTYSNPHLPEDYVQSLRDVYPANLLNAYLEGEFVNLTSGSIYTAFTRDKCNTSITEENGEPLFIGMDFNVGNMSAVVHIKRDGKPIAVAEITGANDTPDMIEVIKSRYSGRSISVYPDASGGSRRSVNAAVTDISELRSAGFNIRAPRANPPVRDRINCMNAAFKNGYKVNVDRCPTYTDCLEQQPYAKNGEPDKTLGLDHLPDAGGYFINHDYPIIKPATQIKFPMAM